LLFCVWEGAGWLTRLSPKGVHLRDEIAELGPRNWVGLAHTSSKMEETMELALEGGDQGGEKARCRCLPSVFPSSVKSTFPPPLSAVWVFPPWFQGQWGAYLGHPQ
jgi:hypothetical protein